MSTPSHRMSDAEAADYLERLRMFFRKRHLADNADDLAQSTLLRLYSKWPEGLASEDAVRLLFGIANNIALEAWKEHRRLLSMEALDAGGQLLPDVHGQKMTESWETAYYRDQLLNSLNEQEQKLLHDFYLSDKKTLARKLGITRSGLGVKVSRILKKLPRFHGTEKRNRPIDH